MNASCQLVGRLAFGNIDIMEALPRMLLDERNWRGLSSNRLCMVA
jgi:hypothetical protein